MQCPNCNKSELYPKTETRFTFGGVASIVIGLFGLGVMMANAMMGILIFIVGLIIASAFRGKSTYLICPACKYRVDI